MNHVRFLSRPSHRGRREQINQRHNPEASTSIPIISPKPLIWLKEFHFSTNHFSKATNMAKEISLQEALPSNYTGSNKTEIRIHAYFNNFIILSSNYNLNDLITLSSSYNQTKTETHIMVSELHIIVSELHKLQFNFKFI